MVDWRIVTLIHREVPRNKWITAREVAQCVPATFMRGFTAREVAGVMREMGARSRPRGGGINEYYLEANE